MILAIDPGPTKSAYALLHVGALEVLQHGIIANNDLVDMVYWDELKPKHFAIEMIASYGMPVGKEVFDTCLWIGRLIEAASRNSGVDYIQQIYRKADVCMNICHNPKAKDSNIRQALIDRFGPVGVKKNPGWFYGVSKDVWSAIAVGVTYHDLYLAKKEEAG